MTLINSEYSSDVPLYRILDVLIDDNEKPEIIFSFLNLHFDDIEDILVHSSSASKIFQLDFIFRCNNNDIEALERIVSSLSMCYFDRILAFLGWQILHVRMLDTCSNKSASLKSFAHKLINRKMLSHPYHYGLGRTIEWFDDEIAKYCSYDNVVANVMNWTTTMTKEYFSSVEWSLFQYRICQYDVIGSMQPDKKFIALRELGNEQTYYIDTLYTQILDSDEHLDVKMMALDAMRRFSYEFDPKSMLFELLECKTFSQMRMKAAIAGEFDMRPLARELLVSRRLDVLYDWMKFDRESLDSCLKISDLVEHELKAA